jgi:hypothetical protein
MLKNEFFQNSETKNELFKIHARKPNFIQSLRRKQYFNKTKKKKIICPNYFATIPILIIIIYILYYIYIYFFFCNYVKRRGHFGEFRRHPQQKGLCRALKFTNSQTNP